MSRSGKNQEIDEAGGDGASEGATPCFVDIFALAPNCVRPESGKSATQAIKIYI